MMLNKQIVIRDLFNSLNMVGFQIDENNSVSETFDCQETEAKFLIFHEISGIHSGEESEASHLAIPVSREVSPEVHGHCASLSLDGQRIVELGLISSDACSISVRTVADGRQGLVLRFRPGTMELKVRLDDFEIVDRGVGDSASDWISTPGARDLWYLMDSALTRSGETKLLVIFSAIGDPHDFTYNYRAGLKDVDANRLFILDDFGVRGSYYWMDHREESIFDSVQELIRKIADSLNIPIAKIIFAGSSKGGTAALIHGVSLGVDEVWAGAPQYAVGDYLYEADNSILKFMTGGSDDSHRLWLNEQGRKILSSGNRETNIKVVVGSKDHHLNNHVIPLKNDADGFGYSCDVLEVEGFPHSQIGKVFTSFLSAHSHAMDGVLDAQVLPYDCTWTGASIIFTCWGAESVSLCVDMYSEEGFVTRLPYIKSSEFVFSASGIFGRVRFRVYTKHDDYNIVKAFTTKWFSR